MSNYSEEFYDNTLIDMLDLGEESDIPKKVHNISQEVYENDLYGGRTVDSMKGGILLTACRSEDLPVTPKEISDDLENTTPRDIILAHRYISKNIECVSQLPTEWHSFLQKFAENLELGEDTVEKAYEIASLGEDSGLLSGRKPRSYAAAAIYSAVNTKEGSSDSWVTQRALCDISNTSESTIRITYQDLLSNYKENDKER